MTEALYYELPMIVECTATVVSCREKDGQYLVALDRTMIFPEGGGQLADRGRISAADGRCTEITDCHTVGGEILHCCSAPFGEGERVRVQLDVERRLDHSEQHTGEHMLSGLASRLFGAVNVGFHMAEDYCTIDLDTELSQEQLTELEEAANRAVRADLPVHTEVTDGDDAAKRSLRKRAEKAVGVVRIVYIDNGKVDSCTCCGTHLERTGRVGFIRIIDSQHYKGGTRLWFDCGARAVRSAFEDHASLTRLARSFSTSRKELEAVVRKQGEELFAAAGELKQRSRRLAELTAETLKAAAARSGGARVICERIDGNAQDLKLILDRFAESEKEPFAALLFASADGGSTDYRMACSKGVKLSMKDLCQAVNAAVNGKGGGNPLFAQGKTQREVGPETVSMLRDYMMKALK